LSTSSTSTSIIKPDISESTLLGKVLDDTPCHENSDKCTLCTYIVDIIQGEMKISNSSINIIEKVIEVICHAIIIKPEREECLAIDNDISNITKWLIDGLYPKDICEKLHFC